MDLAHEAGRRARTSLTIAGNLTPVEETEHASSRGKVSSLLSGMPFRSNFDEDATATSIGAPSHAQIRQALERLVESTTFATVKRSRELVVYLVEEALAGRADGINEYTIAQDVFGRDEHFDPRIDTCVRTEAWRLRRRLQNYYELDGQSDPVRIGFVLRSFVPLFSVMSPPAIEDGAAPRRIVIASDSEVDAGQDGQRLAARLTEEIARGLFQLPSVIPILPGGGDGADFRLQCVVRRDGDRIRIIATLIGDHEAVCGVETFSSACNALAQSPVLIADAVVEMVSRSLSGGIARLPVDLLGRGEHIRYLDQLLRGSYADRSQRLAELRAAVSRYEQTIAYDPVDRSAHRRLIAALGLFLSLAPTATPSVMPKLATTAQNVLSLDDSLSDVWLTLGLASSYTYDWNETERSCRQAIAIAPLDPSPYILLALSYLQRGKIKEALDAAEAASLLDPWSPMVANGYALTLNAARRFTEAAAVALQALEIDPDFVKLRLTLGEAKLNMGQLDGAVEEFEAAYRVMAEDVTVCGLLGMAYGLAGEVAEATSILSKVRQSPDMRAQSICAEAMIHLGLGEREEAIAALGAAVQRRGTPGLFFANAVFDPIRGDRRFSRIQQQMGVAL